MSTRVGMDSQSQSFQACLKFCSGESLPVPDFWTGRASIQRNDQNADELLAQELNSLTLAEREKVYDEIHGVPALPPETPELVSCCIESLRLELPKISRPKRKFYDKAVFLKPSLASDEKFQLMFLRAERYDAQRAARRICEYFDCKHELFGEDLLVEHIRLDVLSDNAMIALENSFFGTLGNDRSGRAVYFYDLRNFVSKGLDWRTMMQAYWYKLESEQENEDTQTGGIVVVFFLFGMDKQLPPGLVDFTLHGHFVNGLPSRVNGFHICSDDSVIMPFLALLKYGMGRDSRLRLRLHHGSELEVRYALQSFGIRIPTELVACGNNERRIMGQDYINIRRGIERAAKEAEAKVQLETPGFFPFPLPNDVLLGRGRPYHTYSGHKNLMSLLDVFEESYFSCTERLQKRDMTDNIVNIIKKRGGRFLRRLETGWVEADDDTAKEKVAQALRMRRAAKQETSTVGQKGRPPVVQTNREYDGSRFLISYEVVESAKRARLL